MATLKSLVDETSNIKNELVECHANLKNNLITKGVECSDNDKMSSLIEKVENIKTPSFDIGDITVLYNDTREETIKPSQYTYFNKEYVFKFDGNYRLYCEMRGTSSTMVSLKMVLLDNNGKTLKEKEFTGSSTTYGIYTLDCYSVRKGYKYKILGKTANTSTGVVVKNFSVKCNMEFN